MAANSACAAMLRDASLRDAPQHEGLLGTYMRALTLVADRKIELLDVPEPPAPQAGEVQLRIKAVGLNHLDVWGWRGMAFAKRKLPLVDGFARDLLNMPARLVIPVPDGVPFRDAACAPIAFGTVQHMLFDNARLEP